jgi:spore coat polysaccharide biosynthesis protein SpsF
MKVTVIIQARMTSSRLPGKILKKVLGRPLLSYLIERLQSCRRVKNIILATTVNPEDDPVAELARNIGIQVFRGSEDNVLDRFYRAATTFGASHIMRITADCPLIDPSVCDRVAGEYFDLNADFVHTGPSFAEGVDCEVFSYGALEKAWKSATLNSEKEHVSLFLHNHPELFKKKTLVNVTDDCKYRFTVDERADFFVVKMIIEALYVKGLKPFSTEKIKEFLDMNQDIFHLNANIIRNEGLLKSIKADLHN